MRKAIRLFKGITTIIVAAAALLAAPSTSHAGNVYLHFFNYAYTTNLSEPTTPLGGSINFSVNAYSFTSQYNQIAGSTGPNGPDVFAGNIYQYSGGPIAGGYYSFNSSVPYWKLGGSYFITNIPYGPNGQVVALYAVAHPIFIPASQVPQ